MDPIIEKVGPDLYFPHLAHRLRCTACNTRNARIMPLWPARGDLPSSRQPETHPEEEPASDEPDASTAD